MKMSVLPAGPKDNFSMVDVYLEFARTHAISAFDHSNTKFIDIGKPESIAKAEKLFAGN